MGIVPQVLGHEFTHRLKQLSADDYARLEAFALSHSQTADEVRARYASLNLSEQDMAEEITAAYAEMLFSDEQTVQRMANEDRGLARRILDFIKDIIGRIRGKVPSELTQAERLWRNALHSAEGRVQQLSRNAGKESGAATGRDAGVQKSEKNSSKAKYHISETFSDEIDAVLNGSMNPNSQVRARDFTPSILVENGVKNLPMLITQKHIKSIVYTEEDAKRLGLDMSSKNHYHGLGKALLIKAIDNMDNPAAIYRKDADHYIIITELRDSNGNDIVIPIKIDGKGTYNNVYIDENQILSVYGRKNLDSYLSKNQFECIYKKGTALNLGTQLPDISSSLSERFSASVNTISQSEDNVNTHDMQISEKYSLDAMDKTEALLEQYGALPEGEREGSAAGREVKVPRQTAKDNRTRRTVRTVMEAAVTSDEIAGDLKEKIEAGEFSYLPTSNKTLLDNAETLVKEKGFEAVLSEWRAHVESTREANDRMLGVGEYLLIHALKTKDANLAGTLAVELSVEATAAGRSVSAVRMIKRLGPAAKVYEVMRTVEKLSETTIERRGSRKAVEEYLRGLSLRAAQKKALWGTLYDSESPWGKGTAFAVLFCCLGR